MNCDQVWLALINNIPAITAAIGALGGIAISLRNGGKLNGLKDSHDDTASKVETLMSNTVMPGQKPPRA